MLEPNWLEPEPKMAKETGFRVSVFLCFRVSVWPFRLILGWGPRGAHVSSTFGAAGASGAAGAAGVRNMIT